MGEKTAIEQALGQVSPPPRQAALALGVPDAPAVEPGKAGRPKGALNRRTEEFRQELRELGAQPGLAAGRLLAEWARDPVGTAQKYGCTLKEMIDKVLRAEELLLPYAEQKLPVAVDVHGSGGLAFAILDPKALLGDGAVDGAPIVLDQGLSDDQTA